MKRNGLVFSAVILCAASAARADVNVAGQLLVNLDAAGLSLADNAAISVWPNGGTAGGSFLPVNAGRGPIFESNVAGAPAATFRQSTDHILTNRVALPPTLVGTAPVYSFEAWIYNPAIAQSEYFFAWTGRDGWPDNLAAGSCVEFRYGNENIAVEHNSANVAWNDGQHYPSATPPAAGAWHHFCVTRDAHGRERLYIDGLLRTYSTPPVIRVRDDGFFTLGAVRSGIPNFSWTGPFGGSISKLRVHSGTLSPAGVFANYQAECAGFGLTAQPDWVWDGSEGGAWETGTNWSGGQVPSATGRVSITDGRPILSTPVEIDRLIAVNGGLTIDNGASLVVLPANSASVNMGVWSNNVFNLTLNHGSLATIDNLTAASFYAGNAGGQFHGTIGNGSGPATLDIGRDLILGGGSTTPRTISRMIVGPDGGMYTSNGWIYVGIDTADAELTVNGGTVGHRAAAERDIRIGRNSAKGILTVNDGLVFSSRDIILTPDATAAATAEVFLNGGAMQAFRIFGADNAATNYFYMNGGSVRNRDSRADFMYGIDFAYVRPGGACFDIIPGTSVTVAQKFLTDPELGDGGITKTGAGTLTLTGANTVTGAVSVLDGQLILGNNNVLPSTYDAPITIAEGASLGYVKSGSLSEILSLLDKASSGTLLVTSANASENIDLSLFPNLRVSVMPGVNYTGTITPYSNTYRFAPTAAETFSQSFSGSATLVVSAAATLGSLEIATAKNFTDTTVDGSMLIMNDPDALGTPGAQPDIGLYNGGSLVLRHAGITDSIISRIKPDSDGYLVLGNPVQTNATFNLSGLPGVILGTDQQTAFNYTGGVAPQSGEYRLGGGRLPFNVGGYDGLIISNLTDGVGGEPRKLVISGYGLVRTNPGNAHSGGTLVTNSAAIHLTSDGGLGAIPTTYDAGNLTVDGGALRHGNANYTVHANRGITVGPRGMTTHPWSNVTLTHNGSLHGSGSITNTDSGNIVLGGVNNTWDGTLTILTGRYLVGNGSTFSWNPLARVNGRGGNFGLNYNGDLLWSTSFGNPLGIAGAGDPGYPLTGINFHKEGTGTLTLDVPQTYTGTTEIRRGTLKIGVADNPLPNGHNRGAVTISYNNAVNYGMLDLNGFDTAINGLGGAGIITNSGSAHAMLTIGGNNAGNTFTGLSEVPVAKIGTGVQTLNAPAEIRADVSIAAGTLAVNPSTIIRDNLNVAAAAQVTVNSNDPVVLTGLTGEYYDFSDAALRFLCDATNFTALIQRGGLVDYRPKVVAGSVLSSNVFAFTSFPSGVPGDYFIARYTGQFLAEAEGEYTFASASDDGNYVFVNGTLVVDNAREQGYNEGDKRSGSISLSTGWHDIEIIYFEKAGSNVLAVWLTPPGGAQQLLPQALLRPRPAAIGTLTGSEGTTLTFAPTASLVLGSDADAEFNGTISATSVSNRIVKTGTGTQAFRGINLQGEADATAGIFAFSPSPLFNRSESTIGTAAVQQDGTLAIRAPAPDWPSGGLMGSYHHILGYTITNQATLFTLGNSFNGRIPEAVHPSTSGGKGVFQYSPNTSFPQPYGSGFDTDFQVLWQGRIVAREAGQYGFRMDSDDRSDLYINGELVVTNASSSNPRFGGSFLAAGSYPLVLPFQQGGGGYNCTLSWALPGTVSTNPIPNAYLRPGGTVLRALESVPGASVTLPDPASFLYLDMADTVAAAAFSGAEGSEIEKAGPNRLTLTGDNDAFLGNWFIPSGELRVGNGGTNGTFGGSSAYVSAGAMLVFDRSDDITVNADIAGLGTIASFGAGTVTLAGNLTGFKGAVNVAENSTVALDGVNAILPAAQATGDGTLRLDNGGGLLLPPATAFAMPLVSSNGVLALAVTNDTSAWNLPELTLVAGTTLDIAPSGLWGRYSDGYNDTAVSNAFLTLASAKAFFEGRTPTVIANTHLQGDDFDFGDSSKSTASFPGKYNNPSSGPVNFCVMWHGKIRIALPGAYTFSTTSDDHSMLYIGDQPVANNNGSHGMQTRSGTHTFSTAGLYDITILYAQGGGGFGMRADILIPGATVAVPIPNAMLVADPEDTPAYTLTVGKINVIGESGAGTVAQAGNGVLKFGALSVDTGTRLAVTGGTAAASGPTLPVTLSEQIPYGVTVVGDFSGTSAGLNLSGVTLQLFGSDGSLRYDAVKDWLQVGRSSGALMILK